jgi:hypothetical protein
LIQAGYKWAINLLVDVSSLFITHERKCLKLIFYDLLQRSAACGSICCSYMLVRFFCKPFWVSIVDSCRGLARVTSLHACYAAFIDSRGNHKYACGYFTKTSQSSTTTSWHSPSHTIGPRLILLCYKWAVNLMAEVPSLYVTRVRTFETPFFYDLLPIPICRTWRRLPRELAGRLPGWFIPSVKYLFSKIVDSDPGSERVTTVMLVRQFSLIPAEPQERSIFYSKIMDNTYNPL